MALAAREPHRWGLEGFAGNRSRASNQAVRAAAETGWVALWSKYRTDPTVSDPAAPAKPDFPCPEVRTTLDFAEIATDLSSTPESTVSETLLYKRATFVTRLPVGHRYSPSHSWLAESAPGRWRVGFTKFALRMLGELVDVQFEAAPGQPLKPGDIVGAIEGFKAVSDLYCVGTGRFVGGNPALGKDLDSLGRDPYAEGWLYEFEGEPDPRCLDVAAYQDLLNETIDRILAKQQAEEGNGSPADESESTS